MISRRQVLHHRLLNAAILTLGIAVAALVLIGGAS